MRSILLLLALTSNLAAQEVRVVDSFQGNYIVECQERNGKLDNPRNAAQLQMSLTPKPDEGSPPRAFELKLIELPKDADLPNRVESATLRIVGSSEQFETSAQRRVQIYHVHVYPAGGGTIRGIMKNVNGEVSLCFTSVRSAFRPRTFDTVSGTPNDPITLVIGRPASQLEAVASN